MFTISINDRTCQANSSEMTSLVDSGTSKHFLDNGMILVHNDHMMNPPVLDVP